MKLNSGTYKYKFAVIFKEQPSFGKSVWRCHMASSFRNFSSRSDAKRYVDGVEANLVRQAKSQNASCQPLFETFYSDSMRPGRIGECESDGETVQEPSTYLLELTFP